MLVAGYYHFKFLFKPSGVLIVSDFKVRGIKAFFRGSNSELILLPSDKVVYS